MIGLHFYDVGHDVVEDLFLKLKIYDLCDNS